MDESVDAPKTVAIIGAGVSGIVAAKSCAEVGLKPVCFEKKSSLGGIWNVDEGECVPYSTITNLCKEFSVFSDFPADFETSIYLTPRKVTDYLEKYAKHFDITRYFRFNHDVGSVEKIADENGELTKWSVKYADDNGEEKEETFDFAIVCSGFYHKKYVPPAIQHELENFSGEVIHSGDYRTWKGYEGKRIVVVGLSNSGGDISCELCRFAKQVWLSTGRGGICFSRVGPHGTPSEYVNFRAYMRLIPDRLVKAVIKSKGNQLFDHKAYGLEPSGSHFSVVVNDELQNRLGTGQIIVKTSIKSIAEDVITFDDGTILKDIDTIVLCTGFTFTCPVLSSDIIISRDNGNFVPLYKRIFPTAGDGSLALTGFQRALGPVFCLTELQARYVAAVFSGKLHLPSQKEMEEDIENMYQTLVNYNGHNCKELGAVSPIKYADELAALIGCKTNILSLFLTDPKLAWRLCFGPWLCFEYRLTGPHCWEGARDAIMTSEERLWYPLKK